MHAFIVALFAVPAPSPATASPEFVAEVRIVRGNRTCEGRVVVCDGGVFAEGLPGVEERWLVENFPPLIAAMRKECSPEWSRADRWSATASGFSVHRWNRTTMSDDVVTQSVEWRLAQGRKTPARMVVSLPDGSHGTVTFRNVRFLGNSE